MTRHRQDDPRAENYDQLLLAEEQAKAKKKGIHGNLKKSVMRRVDYSETPAKARTNLHFIQRRVIDVRLGELPKS